MICADVLQDEGRFWVVQLKVLTGSCCGLNLTGIQLLSMLWYIAVQTLWQFQDLFSVTLNVWYLSEVQSELRSHLLSLSCSQTNLQPRSTCSPARWRGTPMRRRKASTCSPVCCRLPAHMFLCIYVCKVWTLSRAPPHRWPDLPLPGRGRGRVSDVSTSRHGLSCRASRYCERLWFGVF